MFEKVFEKDGVNNISNYYIVFCQHKCSAAQGGVDLIKGEYLKIRLAHIYLMFSPMFDGLIVSRITHKIL